MAPALAVLCAVDLQYNFPSKDCEVILFGCPRVGNRAFQRSYNQRVFKTLRVENGNDIVTKIPLALWGFRHVGIPIRIGTPRCFGPCVHWPSPAPVLLRLASCLPAALTLNLQTVRPPPLGGGRTVFYPMGWARFSPSYRSPPSAAERARPGAWGSGTPARPRFSTMEIPSLPI